MIIKLKDEINGALDFNQSATELFEKINQINENDFTMDFDASYFHRLSVFSRFLCSDASHAREIHGKI